MWWTRQRQAREGVRRAVIRERIQRAGRTALMRTAKPCGPDTRGWCQAAGGEVDPTGSISHQAGSDGGKTNSSPGRARHKPSNHCAGNAGVLRLYLYARVRLYIISCTRDRGCSKHPAFPAPSREGQSSWKNSGAVRRENANTHSSVTVREGGRSSIPDTSMIEPIGRRLLDRPVKSRAMTPKGVVTLSTSLRGANATKQSMSPLAARWIASLRSQ